MGDQIREIKVIGIHIGGPQNKKNAVTRASFSPSVFSSGVSLCHSHFLFSQEIQKIYKETRVVTQQDFHPFLEVPMYWESTSTSIEGTKKVSGDERLWQVIEDMGGADIFCIDTPLTLPPCLECTRTCPGVSLCSVPQTKMMNLFAEQAFKKSRKKRDSRPYVERPFEFCFKSFDGLLKPGDENEWDAPLSSGKAPRTLRGLFFKKRIESQFPKSLILETNARITHTLLKQTIQTPNENYYHMPNCYSDILKYLHKQGIAHRAATLPESVFLEIGKESSLFFSALTALAPWIFLTGKAFIHESLFSLHPDNGLKGWPIIPKEEGFPKKETKNERIQITSRY